MARGKIAISSVCCNNLVLSLHQDNNFPILVGCDDARVNQKETQAAQTTCCAATGRLCRLGLFSRLNHACIRPTRLQSRH